MHVTKKTVFASLTLAALLALGTGAGAAEQDSKSADNDAKSQAELERKLADARKRLDEAVREVANLSMSMSDDVVPHMRTFGRVMGGGPPRAVLGINLGSNDDVKGGGVEVVSVSPGGAAERAGLKAGDVLTEINGKALKSEGDESAREQLLSAMRKVKPGDSVAAELPARQQGGQGQPRRAAAAGSVLHDGRAADGGDRTRCRACRISCSCAAKACSAPRSWCR